MVALLASESHLVSCRGVVQRESINCLIPLRPHAPPVLRTFLTTHIVDVWTERLSKGSSLEQFFHAHFFVAKLASVCKEYHERIFVLEAAKWDLERLCKIKSLEVNAKKSSQT